MAPGEPRNPFYMLLLVIGLMFVLTVLAVAVVPILEEKALDAGETPPPSPFRDALREDGWKWLLYEVAALVIVGLLSMGLDRWRRYRSEHAKSGVRSQEPGIRNQESGTRSQESGVSRQRDHSSDP